MAADFIIYRGAKYWLQKSGRYYATREKINGERLLHRRIWADANGPIPAGHHIHHRDHDWEHNSLDNLECVHGKKHHADHMRERHAAGVGNADALAKARLEAAKWHASQEGLAWHSEHGKRTWDNRKPVGAKCVRCKASYWTFNHHSKFCSVTCRQASDYKRQHTVRCNCDFCGKEFMRNKYRKTACCSRACANRARAADQR